LRVLRSAVSGREGVRRDRRSFAEPSKPSLADSNGSRRCNQLLGASINKAASNRQFISFVAQDLPSYL
jgi:hypothetical protein